MAGPQTVASSPGFFLRKTAVKRTLPQGGAHSRCGHETRQAPRSPYSPPHSQVWSPSTCGHNFDEVGWFLLFWKRNVSGISWFRAEGAWRNCHISWYRGIGLGLCSGSFCGWESPPLAPCTPWGGCCFSGDHLVGDCPLPTQALVTLTPSVPFPCAFIPKPPVASWYMERRGPTGTFLLARPLIYPIAVGLRSPSFDRPPRGIWLG